MGANITLGFRAGKKYRHIVSSCLDVGPEGIENDDATVSGSQQRLRKHNPNVRRDESNTVTGKGSVGEDEA